MQGHFLKIPPLKKVLEFQDWKKTTKLVQKKTQTRKTSDWKLTRWTLSIRKQTKKVLNFLLTSNGSWRYKNVQKPFSKYLNNRICKIKQYLNYILTIMNQSILAILRTFLNLQKKFMKHFTRGDNSQSCYYKISSRKQISNEQFNLCETKISFDQIIKLDFQIKFWDK